MKKDEKNVLEGTTWNVGQDILKGKDKIIDIVHLLKCKTEFDN